VDGGRIQCVTLFDNFLYVLPRLKFSEQIEVYDKDSYRLQRCLTVHGLRYPVDIAFCVHYRCGYISDSANSCIHRLALPRADVTQWPVNEYAASLSVTDKHSVLVTCCKVRIIKEFTTHGQQIRKVQLPGSITSPRHTVQLSTGELVVCHGDTNDSIHGVSLIDSGGQVVRSYGGLKGSSTRQVSAPTHAAVDSDSFVYVADRDNGRVLLLSPSLSYIREIVMLRHKLKSGPERLCLDHDTKCLYVIADGRLAKVSL